jgi:triacylglycerol lipase
MTQGDDLLVFVSGLGGFERIGIPGFSISYFRGLRDYLRRQGITAHFPPQRPFASVAERAEYLARYLDALPGRRILLVAHSMGGLDCRYLIHHLDRDMRVRGLATVATPHRGTPLADWFFNTEGALQRVGRWLLNPALGELRLEACARFNKTVADRPDVVYHSYAGVRPVEEVPLIFRPWSNLIAAQAGENDSQVPRSSAMWGQFKGDVRADHFEMAGWSFRLPNRNASRPFDACFHYANVVNDLVEATKQTV